MRLDWITRISLHDLRPLSSLLSADLAIDLGPVNTRGQGSASARRNQTAFQARSVLAFGISLLSRATWVPSQLHGAFISPLRCTLLQISPRSKVSSWSLRGVSLSQLASFSAKPLPRS